MSFNQDIYRTLLNKLNGILLPRYFHNTSYPLSLTGGTSLELSTTRQAASISISVWYACLLHDTHPVSAVKYGFEEKRRGCLIDTTTTPRTSRTSKPGPLHHRPTPPFPSETRLLWHPLSTESGPRSRPYSAPLLCVRGGMMIPRFGSYACVMGCAESGQVKGFGMFCYYY